jgi:F-type H+-transporting ATPase subunit b
MADLHEVAEPLLFGLIPPVAIVSASMAVLIAIMLWKKVPAVVTGMLDKQIAAIRDQLEEARQLRAEAERLRAEYAARIAGAEKDAEAMLLHARQEAEAIVTRAAKDTADVIGRREKMASDKIAAAEQAAIAELRLRAVDAAAGAAGQLIAARLGAEADAALVNGAIAGLVN